MNMLNATASPPGANTATRNYAIVTAAYWGFTLTDGALRMLVLLHFYRLGYSPFTLAFLFLLYEAAGVLANLIGGWLATRYGIQRMLTVGLVTQITGFTLLSLLNPAWTAAMSVAWVVVAQGICGVAKDLTKTASKSAIKITADQAKNQGSGQLFKWVAWFTGSKNAMKGFGFFLGGLMLTSGINIALPEKSGGRALALTPLLAVGLHSFLDGVIYSVTFAASFEAGVYASTSLIIHEFAEGVIAFAILSRHGFRVREALIWAFLAAGATTPLGALVSGVFLTGLGPGVVAALYALSAGLLIYVATGPLMQPLKEEPPLRGVAALGCGVLIAFLLLLLPIHGHIHGATDDHDHEHQHIHVLKDPSGIHPPD